MDRYTLAVDLIDYLLLDPIIPFRHIRKSLDLLFLTSEI